MSAKPSQLTNQLGSTIIYVLFIMLVAMILTTTFTTIMLRNIQVATSYSQSARAALAAESGIERALYYVQWSRNQRTVGVEEVSDTVNTYFTNTLAGDASYTVADTVTNETLVTDLAVNQTKQWDFFDEDYTGGYLRLKELDDLDNIRFHWNETASCTAGASQVEIAFSSWTRFQWEDISDPGVIQTRYLVTCPGATDEFDCDHRDLGVDSGHLYKVKVKALSCDLTDVTVTALNSIPATIPTTNQIELTATGTYLKSQRSITATTLWRAPLQHYFDFVLFSEDQITK